MNPGMKDRPSCDNFDPIYLLPLVAATREIGLEVSADKTKYMVMSRDHNAGRNHSVRIDNSTFERVEELNIWKQL